MLNFRRLSLGLVFFFIKVSQFYRNIGPKKRLGLEYLWFIFFFMATWTSSFFSAAVLLGSNWGAFHLPLLKFTLLRVLLRPALKCRDTVGCRWTRSWLTFLKKRKEVVFRFGSRLCRWNPTQSSCWLSALPASARTGTHQWANFSDIKGHILPLTFDILP